VEESVVENSFLEDSIVEDSTLETQPFINYRKDFKAIFTANNGDLDAELEALSAYLSENGITEDWTEKYLNWRQTYLDALEATNFDLYEQPITMYTLSDTAFLDSYLGGGSTQGSIPAESEVSILGVGRDDTDGASWVKVSVDGNIYYVPAEGLVSEPFQPDEQTEEMYLLDSTPFRNGYNDSSEVVHTGSRGDSVTVVAEGFGGAEGWYRVKYGDTEVYVWNSHISEEKPVEVVVDTGSSGSTGGSGTGYTGGSGSSGGSGYSGGSGSSGSSGGSGSTGSSGGSSSTGSSGGSSSGGSSGGDSGSSGSSGGSSGYWVDEFYVVDGSDNLDWGYGVES
jgi:hypothetical protein